MRTLVVAIPQLEGKCTEKHSKMGTSAIFGGSLYPVPFNRGIATTSVRTGLAMTAFFQTPIKVIGFSKHTCIFRIYRTRPTMGGTKPTITILTTSLLKPIT